MNDRLKFRVWSVKEKSYDHKFPFNSLGIFYIAETGRLFSDFGNSVAPEMHEDKYIIEQCTGLKDKNGNLIYEGDIVRGAENTVGTVKFGKHGYDSINVGFYIQWDMKHPWRYDIGYWTAPENPDCIEIIGNIHEQKDSE